MSTDTKIKKLIINRMTKSQFDSLPTKNENELYFVEDDDTFLTKADAEKKIPTKTSELTNDSNFVVDESYVHTDTNFTQSEKTKLEGIEEGAQVNIIKSDVPSDTNQYVRQDGAWVKVTIPTVDVNKQYVDEELGKKVSTTTYNQDKSTFALKTDLDFWKGVNTVSTLTNLPITKRSIVATVTAATNLSLATDMEVGKELYIRVFNNSTGKITQAIPNAGKYVSMSGASVKIPSKSFIEISIWCYATNKYSIRVGEVIK